VIRVHEVYVGWIGVLEMWLGPDGEFYDNLYYVKFPGSEYWAESNPGLSKALKHLAQTSGRSSP